MKSVARFEALDTESRIAPDDLVLNGPTVHGRDDLHDLILGTWRRTEIVSNFEDMLPLQEVKGERPALAAAFVLAVADFIENR
ncbi:hypothetical protein [Mesorhizobium sp.]|uniref:hypothetical protein n=1 Tax=Mesorhizobium sp. TaxID=1871066 RepID=UPI0025FE8BEF|nr:hypothetical protein [Mesorhizobium sp.]